MTTLSKVEITRAWTLVYDAAASGSFTGSACSIDRSPVAYRVAASLPAASDPGMTPQQWVNISLSQTKGQKLYAKSTDDSAQILLDSSMGQTFSGDLADKLAQTVDVFGQMTTAEYTPIVSQKPLPGLSFLRDKKVGGDAEFSVVGGEIRIDGAPGKRSLYTKDYGLYLPGLLGLAGIRTRLETPNSGTYAFGYGNGLGERIYLQNIDGAWSTNVMSETVVWYTKDRSEWLDPLDGTGPSGITADMNGTTLRIILGWYGGLSILFTALVADRLSGDRLVVFDATGPRENGVTLKQPDLPIFAEATGGVMYVGGRQYGVFGRFIPQYRITSNRAVTKAISTTLIPIVSFNIKDEQRWASVPVKLAGESVSATVDSEFVVIIGGTLTGAVWESIDGIDPEETALEMDTTATAIAGGYRAQSSLVAGAQGNKSSTPISDLLDVSLPSGTTVTLAAVALSGSGDFTGIMRMRELH